ncbi:hypothetical protein G7046_g4164 [Stylonectria norvegica]|nr:hypothetical protein G7046_g4164 [Stylonectria norvegica]
MRSRHPHDTYHEINIEISVTAFNISSSKASTPSISRSWSSSGSLSICLHHFTPETEPPDEAASYVWAMIIPTDPPPLAKDGRDVLLAKNAGFYSLRPSASQPARLSLTPRLPRPPIVIFNRGQFPFIVLILSLVSVISILYAIE